MIGMCDQFKMLCENISILDKKEDGFTVVDIDHTTYRVVKCSVWRLPTPTITFINNDGCKKERKNYCMNRLII